MVWATYVSEYPTFTLKVLVWGNPTMFDSRQVFPPWLQLHQDNPKNFAKHDRKRKIPETKMVKMILPVVGPSLSFYHFHWSRKILQNDNLERDFFGHETEILMNEFSCQKFFLKALFSFLSGLSIFASR